MRIAPASAVMLLAVSATWVAVNEARPAGGEKAIRAGDLRSHVEFLASDAMRGRETGKPGVARAEEYVAAQFRGNGLRPLPGREDFFLDVTLYRAVYDRQGTSLQIDLGDRRMIGKAGVDFRPFGFSSEGITQTPVVFAGYGITAPEHGHDDYEGLDVEGKIVLILRHEPKENDPESPFDGIRSSDHALFATKAKNAQDHGARGMLLVTDPLHHPADEDLRLGGSLRLSPAEDEDAEADDDEEIFVAAHIRQALAEAIVARSGRTLSDLQRAIDDGQRPAAVSPLDGVGARLSVKRAEKSEAVPARNVAGYLPGSDPELRDEWIVIGGHHDHIGGFDGAGDTIFNGADDNASGTSGVLELAEAFARGERRPRRSLVFVTFTGEESGLLGSRAAVTQELIPAERVAFMLNLDMIGRNPSRALDVVGDGYARGLREVVEAANRDAGLDLDFQGTSYSGNSDHDAFFEADVPFMFFFTGTHDDYHQLGDHADKLDYKRMQSIVRVAYRVVEDLANADRRPRFVHNISWLGVRVEIEDGPDGGTVAKLTSVEEDSRGAEAGLREADVITAFGESALEDAGHVGKHFRDIGPGNSTTLGVRRDGEKVTVAVTRAKTGFMGVFPGPVDDDLRKTYGLGDGQGIKIRGVSRDGPSARAGLLAGDLVVAMAGKPIGPGQLGSRLAQIGAGETVELQVIRDGERIELQLTLGERPQRP